MKKITLIIAAVFIAMIKLSAQIDSAFAAGLITTEAMKIQYVFEGQVVKAEMYAGDLEGHRLHRSDMVYDASAGGISYAKLSDGGSPVCYSIATIRVCQVYKGVGITDTIKILTANRAVQFSVKVSGSDTTINYIFMPNGFEGKTFIKSGMVGFSAIFFAYNHTYLGVSSSIKILSTIGNIDFHTKRYNPSSYDPADRVFASSTGALFYAHAKFYSREELYDSLANMPLLGLNVSSPNACLPPSAPAEKKNAGSDEKQKIDYQQNLKNYNDAVKKSLEQYEKYKKRSHGLKRTSNKLTLEMANPRVTGTNPDVWLEFDIMASSDNPTWFNRCALYISYDSSLVDPAFHSSIFSQGHVQVTRAPAFNATATYDDPQTYTIDKNTHTFAIAFGADFGGTIFSRVQLTSTPQKMLQVRMKILNREKPAAIFFFDTATSSNASSFTAASNSPVFGWTPYDHPTQYVGTNNDKTCVPIITSFNNTVPGGVGEILTIEGRYFGDSLDRNIKSVIFRNANRGNNYPGSGLFRDGVDNYDILAWNHKFIKIKLPSVFDSLTNDASHPDYYLVPASGRFMVKNKYTNIGETNNDLKIPYSILQQIDTNNYSNYTKTNPKLAGMNFKNGYTVHCSNALVSAYPAAKAVIRKAMREWTCITGINWVLGSDTSLGAVYGDGICVIDINSGIYGLMDTRSEIVTCFTNNPHQYFLRSFDIRINSNGSYTWEFDTLNPLGVLKLDFNAIISHELGHAHFLCHVNDPITDLMHYVTPSGPTSFANRITITKSPDAKSGGQYVTTNLKSSTNCSSSHTLVSCGGTGIKNISDYNKSKVIVFPNPISNGYLTIETNQYYSEGTYFLIFDNMGRIITRIELSSMQDGEYKVPVDNLASGIYLLQIVSSNLQQSVKFIKQ